MTEFWSRVIGPKPKRCFIYSVVVKETLRDLFRFLRYNFGAAMWIHKKTSPDAATICRANKYGGLFDRRTETKVSQSDNYLQSLAGND